ncbi:hypothetical protein [Streptomyces rishiriensis]|uniref:Integral membrane protein n=1 Tax=Streptomyces rishiriensis TaxID=68264 RepID=A0ABU0NUT3_STRRH|nr:hypothetical protein [Streptomyces rishiriensis]MDQ0582190.1 hypothetical protein [Streptomyces rishiriensis]
MARRTGRGAAVWRAVVRSAVVAAVLCGSSSVLPGQDAVAAPDVPPYAFADDVRGAPAATGTTGAARLEPGATYRSSLREGRAYYRLELDGTSNVYVSVTAIPRAGAALLAGDGISVSVQDSDSTTCSTDSVTVGAARSPQPLTAWGARELLPGKGLCQKAGTYYVVVEPTGSGGGSGEEGTDLPDAQSWDLELAPVSESPLAKAAATRVPEVWDSATPTPPVDEPAGVRGGAGFTEAAAVKQGVWSDEIVPGQTLFYQVPVDWGRQLSATVDLGSADKNSGYVVDALDLTLYNPVRASVKDTGIGYGGSQKSASLPPVPPVGYANRYAPTEPTKSLRFAGSYYLVVHLAAQVAERFGEGPYGLTLRIGLSGSTQAGPGYARQSAPRGFFDVGAPDPEPPAGGDVAGADASGAGTSGGDRAMKAVAVGGIGTGSLLLTVLGVWTLAARRRAAAQMRVNAQNPTA